MELKFLNVQVLNYIEVLQYSPGILTPNWAQDGRHQGCRGTMGRQQVQYKPHRSPSSPGY